MKNLNPRELSDRHRQGLLYCCVFSRVAADRNQEKRDKTAEHGVTHAARSHGDLVTLYSHPLSMDACNVPLTPPRASRTIQGSGVSL